ncbi:MULTISPECIES: hypothetical protein [Halobellus]|uniref:hypothetical protein n=1 Tax=Halobellus TaxID=1073986 RepID=UPI00210BE772|nr:MULTISPECIES: hypothetical protein [Halobellus]MDQ2055968.1 hypothetical protein [Halobellus sp. H-GB7]
MDKERHLERDRGMLTKKDREYLLGEQPDINEHTETQKRHRIRKRVRNALLDFPLLRHMQTRDRNLIFEDLNVGEDGPSGDVDLYYSIVDMIQFAYIGLKEQDADAKRPVASAIWNVESVFPQMYEDEWVDVEVDITVDIKESVDLEAAIEKLRRGEDITSGEAWALLDAGRITPNEFKQIYEGNGDIDLDVVLRLLDAY